VFLMELDAVCLPTLVLAAEADYAVFNNVGS
jgi:hypothetical protein